MPYVIVGSSGVKNTEEGTLYNYLVNNHLVIGAPFQYSLTSAGLTAIVHTLRTTCSKDWESSAVMISPRTLHPRISSRRSLIGLAALVAVGLVSVYIYYSRPSTRWNWAYQQSATPGHVKFGLDEQNRLIEAIYQVSCHRAFYKNKFMFHGCTLLACLIFIFFLHCRKLKQCKTKSWQGYGLQILWMVSPSFQRMATSIN